MGFETIRDKMLQENWKNFTNIAHKKLQDNGISDIIFSTFKYDGSYGKARTGLPAVYWAFAQDSYRTWVELELKSRISKNERYAQRSLYLCIKEKYNKSSNKIDIITWDENDRNSDMRNPAGMDIRIKIYLRDNMGSNLNEEWSATMIKFVKVFKPILDDCK